MRPAGDSALGVEVSGVALQVVGLTVTCVAFLYLGRSFGVVAANRGLKVGGPYRLVRHPIYLSHAITVTGFLVANFSFANLSIYGVLWVCQLMRIQAEERVLSDTGNYAAYRARVRWRLLPGLY
jgi:protein-S-isoprenylcysteine O-methyltransferase Ste14